MVLRTALRRFNHWKSAPHWLVWASLNLCIAGYFVFSLVAPASSIKTAWLPGTTTHGHYQIELDCNACHAPTNPKDPLTASDVMQDACIRCHGEQLRLAKDTHPAKKFRDPTNADLLAVLDAQDCLTCHREHVPERTLAMGLTMPADYCWHCHQEVADNRPSHKGMRYDSCATAGCHNYHDNRALYEKFLNDHFGEPDFREDAALPARDTLASLSENDWPQPAVGLANADHPGGQSFSSELMSDWADTAHAAAGVNCSHCHVDSEQSDWSDSVAMETCGRCHRDQMESFSSGKHGMRLAAGLSPMTPGQARLAMHAGASHAELTCNACHSGHRFDTEYAAAEACLRCHADDHSLAYADTTHAQLWRDEVAGDAPRGSGVSCATCHLPRLEGESGTWVNHDQNASLRPNETMAREVCLHCHGLEYSLSALADPDAAAHCYGESPSERVESVQLAHDWFALQEAKRKSRQSRKKK